MALIRRCARFLCIRTKFVNLNDKHKTHILNELNPTNIGYVLQFQTKPLNNSQYESNLQSDKPTSDSHPETNDTHDPAGFSNPSEINGMCYAEVKDIVDKKLRDLSSIEQTYGIRLLKSCRDMLPDADLQSRRKLVDQVWDLLEKLDQNLTTEHYNILLSIYAQNSHYLNAEEFLQSMKATPNKDTYRLLLDAVAEIGDYRQVLTIMTKTKEMGYPINEATFNSLISAYSTNADVAGAQTVLETMQAARIELSPATYCALSRGFAAKGDLGNLERTLKTGNLNPKQFMLVVKSLSTSGHSEFISQVMKYRPKEADIKNNDVLCTIVELTHLGKAKDALDIVNSLPVPETASDPSVGFADFFLCEMVKANTPMEEILQICGSLVSYDKNSSPIVKVTEASLRFKKEEMALLAFQAMEARGFEIRPHFYWPLLLNAASNKQETDLIRLVKHMIDNRVDVDNETLRNYIIPFLSARDPVMIVRQLQDCGMKISQLLTPFLANLLSKGNLKGAIALTDKIKGTITRDIVIKQLLQGFILTKNANATAQLLSNINSNSDQNGKFLVDLLAIKKVAVTNEELGSLVFAFGNKNLKISRASAEVLEPKIARLKERKDLWETFKGLINPEASGIDTLSDVFIPHPRDMNAEELENHLVDLTSKSMNTRGVLRRLIQTHCGKNNLSKAEEFAKMFDKKGFEWTTGMISGMFSLYAAHNMFDEAEVRYQELKEKHKGFKIDEHKIIDYATALANNNRVERALEILGEQKNVRSRPENIRNCWRFLNAVADTGDSKNMKRTLDLLIEKGYCEVTNHVLGPLVRMHLSKGDLRAAVAQLKECASIHRKVPLKQELLRAIIQTYSDESEAREQLVDVLAVIKSIHGDAAANSQLFMALAATNRQKELHSFIKTPAVNQTTLNISAEKLTDEKDLSALQTILKACRGVAKLNNTIVYDSILTLCSRSGDCETALQVWEKMQSEDVSPSAKFVDMLKNLLKSQRVPLPSELLASKGIKKS